MVVHMFGTMSGKMGQKGFSAVGSLFSDRLLRPNPDWNYSMDDDFRFTDDLGPVKIIHMYDPALAPTPGALHSLHPSNSVLTGS
jgi:hypothetical protein